MERQPRICWSFLIIALIAAAQPSDASNTAMRSDNQPSADRCLRAGGAADAMDSLADQLAGHRAITWMEKISLRREARQIQGEIEHAQRKPEGLNEVHRDRFDRLVDRIVGLIRDADPDLADEIMHLRETIWENLEGSRFGCPA